MDRSERVQKFMDNIRLVQLSENYAVALNVNECKEIELYILELEEIAAMYEGLCK